MKGDRDVYSQQRWRQEQEGTKALVLEGYITFLIVPPSTPSTRRRQTQTQKITHTHSPAPHGRTEAVGGRLPYRPLPWELLCRLLILSSVSEPGSDLGMKGKSERRVQTARKTWHRKQTATLTDRHLA